MKIPGQVVRSTALVRGHDERMGKRNKNRVKVQGRGVGLDSRAGHRFVPFLTESCWGFALFLCVQKVS